MNTHRVLQIGNRYYALAFAVLLALASAASGQESRTYAGLATNITVGQAARFQLNMTLAGDTITAAMTTEAPLAGRANLRGGVTNGLCKLSGDATEGFRVDFSGTLDADQLAQCRDAQKNFLREHLGRWTPAFARRLASATGEPTLKGLADFTRTFIESECARFGVNPGSDELALRPVDETADRICDSCGIHNLPPGALAAT